MSGVTGVALRAMAAAVPCTVHSTADYAHLSVTDRERLQKATGIARRRISQAQQCASDLCAAAARRVIAHLAWSPADIGLLVLITQTADQPIPATAITLQNRLGLSTRCIAFDINLGCSAMPFGLATVASMMKTLGIARALLLMGDVSSRVCAENDKSTWPLFGDAGSAVALELDQTAPAMLFDLMSDGSGKDAIIVPGGGLASRLPTTTHHNMATVAVEGGVPLTAENLVLRGADVFTFAISKVPLSIQRVLDAAGAKAEDVDFLVLHQANKMINDTIAKKTRFPPEKLPYSLGDYGNTSSASIPVTFCAHADSFAEARRVAVSGFGVGLSWGTVLLELPAGVALPIVETDEAGADAH